MIQRRFLYQQLLTRVVLFLASCFLCPYSSGEEEARPVVQVVGRIVDVSPKNDPRGMPSRLRWALKIELTEENRKKLNLEANVIEFYIHSPVRDLLKTAEELKGARVVLQAEGEIKKQNFSRLQLLRHDPPGAGPTDT